MNIFHILPLETVYENYEAESEGEALIDFATKMDSDMNSYFRAVPKESTGSVIAERIASLIRSTDLTAGQCSDIFRALSDKAAVIGGKLWTTEDVRGAIDAKGYPSGVINMDDVYEVADNVDADRLNDCIDNEWEAIHEAIRETLPEKKVIVTDIDWDTEDADDADLPKEVMITLGELRGFEDIAEYLSSQYEYAVNAYVISKE